MFERVVFLITYGCGHRCKRGLPVGPGTEMVKQRLRDRATTALCPSCMAKQEKQLAAGPRWDERY